MHTVVSFDFAVSIVPLWHATIFPPFFVAGAIFSGFAMVVWLADPAPAVVRLEDFITDQHMDMLRQGDARRPGCSSATATSAKSGWRGTATAIYEWGTTIAADVRPVRLVVLVLIFSNFVIPQLLWFKKFRQERVLAVR